MRILFGSTQKMGTGANVQERLIALHHLDAPWRPADVEQREGRILRQGNLNREVQVYRYVTEESFDAYMWQTLETKARFIAQVMSGESDLRRIEDIDGTALTYAEVKAIASGNPMVIEKASIDAELARLSRLRQKPTWQDAVPVADADSPSNRRSAPLGETSRRSPPRPGDPAGHSWRPVRYRVGRPGGSGPGNRRTHPIRVTSRPICAN